jgi:rod shape-determining protein MreC
MIVGILADERIKPGEVVLTAGGDLVYPRGLPVGVVDKVIRDPERDAFIQVMVKPAARLDRLDEVLILTSLEPRFGPQEQKDINTSELLKGPEAAAIKDQAARDEAARQQAIRDQMKASQIMAERLPGLTDPNAPAAQAPGAQTAPKPGQSPGQPAPPATAAPAPKLLPALHPDRFSPGAASAAVPQGDSGSAAKPPQSGASTGATAHPTSKPASEAGSQSVPKPDSKANAGTKSGPGVPPRRNP